MAISWEHIHVFICKGISVSLFNHLPSSLFLPAVLSGVSGPGGPVWQAEHSNCREPERWNVKPLWCFKHDAVVGRTCSGLCLVNNWGACQRSWQHYLALWTPLNNCIFFITDIIKVFQSLAALAFVSVLKENSLFWRRLLVNLHDKEKHPGFLQLASCVSSFGHRSSH